MKSINYLGIITIAVLFIGAFGTSWDGSELYNTMIYNNLTVNGTGNFTGNVDVGGYLNVSGATIISGNVDMMDYNITNISYVGIGTSTPAQLIHMVGNGSSSTGWARFGTSTTEYTEIGHKGSNGAINTVGDGNLDFRHDGVTLMNLTDTGNVSIVGNITIMGGLTCLNADCTWNMTGNCMYYPNGAKVGTDC